MANYTRSRAEFVTALDSTLLAFPDDFAFTVNETVTASDTKRHVYFPVIFAEETSNETVTAVDTLPDHHLGRSYREDEVVTAVDTLESSDKWTRAQAETATAVDTVTVEGNFAFEFSQQEQVSAADGTTVEGNFAFEASQAEVVTAVDTTEKAHAASRLEAEAVTAADTLTVNEYAFRSDEVVTAVDQKIVTPVDHARTETVGAGIVDETTTPDLGGDTRWTEPLVGQGHQIFTNDAGLASDPTTPDLGGGSEQERWTDPLQQAGALLPSTTEPDPSGMVDEVETPDLGGGSEQERWTDPLQQAGALSSDPGAMADGVIAALDPAPDYMEGVTDGDGHDFLGDTGLEQVFFYDATADDWHDPTGTGFTGIARDGKNYYAGTECAPGDFGTLAGGVRKSAWSDDVEPLAFWSDVTGSVSMVSDDHVRFSGTFTGYAGKGVTSRYHWYLTGDFDIEVQFENFSSSGGTDGGFYMEAVIDYDNYIYVRRNGSGVYDSDVRNNAVWGSYVSTATSDTSGRLRIVRSGSTVSSYYWTGSWTLLRSGIALTAGAKAMQVSVAVNGDGNRTLSADAFSFVINSGSTTNTSGWSREASGSHRGTRDDFPTHAVIVSTMTSLDIIDTDNDRLWMRFVGAASNALFNGSAERPARISMQDGVLMWAQRHSTSTLGGSVYVDFKLDDIQVPTSVGSGVTGGLYRASNGGTLSPAGHSPREVCPHGIIASRNSALGYFSDFNNWQEPAASTNDADVYHSSGYQYRVFATAGGAGAHRWRHGYFDGAAASAENLYSPEYGASTETAEMRYIRIDPATGDIYYMSLTTLYHAEDTTWLAGVSSAGGSWSNDNSKALPGTRNAREQYDAVFNGSDIYVPANEGVYKVTWPGGSFSLFYGKSGSGATHEILPDYDQITSLAVTSDAGTDLLVCGLAWNGGAYSGDHPPPEGQLVVVRLDTNVVWAKAAITSTAQAPRTVAA